MNSGTYYNRFTVGFRKIFNNYRIIHCFNELSSDWVDYIVFSNGDIYEIEPISDGRGGTISGYVLVDTAVAPSQWAETCKRHYLKEMWEKSEFDDLTYYLESDKDNNKQIEYKHIMFKTYNKGER